MSRLTNIQQRLTGAGFLASALIAALIHIVGLNEGRSLEAYQDSAGVWTICDGETLGVKPGQKATESDCDAMVLKGIARHAEAIQGLPEGLPDVVLLGSMDTAYNIGVYGFRNSGMYRALLNKDYQAAGAAVLKWKYISQKAAPRPGKGWEYDPKKKLWRFDCSQSIDGEPNKVCYGLWKRRLWQAQALANRFSTPEAAVAALPK